VSNFPIPYNEKDRLRALDSYDVLNSLSEAEYDRITELASIICDVPISLISLVDEKRQWFKSKVGLDIRETSRDLAFCQYAIMGSERFDVEDAVLDERFKNNQLVNGDPNIRFYSGQPLIDPNGFALGTICVMDRKPRVLTAAQKRALEILAGETIALIVERKQKHELQYFEKLFQVSNDLICIAGTDGYFKKINGAFSRLLGWDEQYILNTSSFEFVHPDDHELTRTELGKITAGLPEISFLQRLRTKAGGYRIIQWSGTPEGVTGNIFGVGRDITEEKNKEHQLAVSEGKLRAFFENSQGFMCTHDLNGKFLSVNNSGASVLGYTVDEILQMTLFDIIPVARHPFMKEYLETIRATGMASGQMATLHKNGSHKIWMYNNVLQVSPDGEEYVIGNGSDVSERHYLQIDLERTKELLEQTNKVARVGGWQLDMIKQKLSWTAETKIIHGVPLDFEPNLAGGINFYKEGESRDAITKAVNQAISEGAGYDLELQIVKADGNDLWVRVLGNSELENGQCKRLYGTFQDIDDKKKTELEVIASRKFLNDIMHASSEVSIVTTDTTGLITLFNTGAENILGYTAEEMVGKQTTDIFRTPEDIAARKKEIAEEHGYEVGGFRITTERTDRKGSEQREWTAIKKDGSRILISSVVTPIRDDKNVIIGYLIIATDITEKKEVENALITEKARLSAFVEHAPAAVAMMDNDMNYIAASNVWLEDFQLKGRQIIGRSYYNTFPNLDMARKDRHQAVLKGAVECAEEDTFFLEGQDDKMFLSWEMRPWYLYSGDIGGMMISTQNITAIVKRREELKAAILLAEQASEAKSEFLANMSHEIRTPLNGVIGFTDLVLKTNLNETQQQYLNIVNQSANALLSIINDILDFSKIEAGKLELDVEKCDLYELSGQATDIISYQVQTKGLEMLLNISATLPRFIWADALRLKQVLINLLGNATKFTETGEIELKIEAIAKQDDSTTIRFSVRDTGIGIKPDQQSKIFHAFSQEDASTTKKYGGTGLGLTISNRLLGLMGSELQLKSTPGIGSIFFFDIILKTEEGTRIEWENIELIKNVLIVDDNENNRLILSRMLLLKQINTVETNSGFEALQVLATGQKFDVIIMDYHMPHINGLDTIKKIREAFSGNEMDLPVILLYSSSDDGAIIKACDDLQIRHRLVKPVKMQDIYNTLSQLHIKEKHVVAQLPGKKRGTIPNDLNIIIAEDNAVNMLLAKTIIKRIAPNTHIIEARSGNEALAYCKKNWPDLILMDVQMPEMNGYDATRQIRALQADRNVPIIALTAGNVKGEREKCLAAGMDDFVVKPIVEETLEHLFMKWFDGPKTDPEAKQVNKETDPATHFNIDVIKVYLGDDVDLINEVISLTKRELAASLTAIEDHINSTNLKAINLSGHKLYGTATSTGLPVLAKIAHQFEHIKTFTESELKMLLNEAKHEVDVILKLMGN
jgi:PAS domain S-box-containing protein